MNYRYNCIYGKPILWAKKKQVCVFGTQKLRPRLRRVGKLAFCSRWSQKDLRKFRLFKDRI
jgi:hypothetical protein